MNRRQWFHSIMRWTLLTLLAVIGSVFLRRRIRAGCSTTLEACHDCFVVSRCTLVAAKSHRARVATVQGKGESDG